MHIEGKLQAAMGTS